VNPRGLARRVVRRLRGQRPVILMYHRVAEPALDPWGLAVPARTFEDQIAALRRWRRPMAMDEFVGGIGTGKLPRDAVAITFDDGYRDNFDSAKPILEAAGVPATMFLTTGHIGSEKPYWWDELALMVLGRKEPLDDHIRIGSRQIDAQLPAWKIGDTLAWTYTEGPRTERQRIYLELWSTLQTLSDLERAGQLERLRQLFGAPEATPEDLPMSTKEASLLASRHIDIGAHAETHTPLTSQCAKECERQIRQSRADCQRLTGRVPSGFAFPHGNRSQEVINAVRNLGFKWACSTEETPIKRKGTDLHDLPRIGVGRWSGAELLKRIG
jgi:peptidoglycan/xylan/chitin deacetylase (PgdA/CDA1 family)